jgi:transcriptional regulator with XRE-family HTH domain
MIMTCGRGSPMAPEKDAGFGARLKELRQAAGLTQFQLAVRASLQPASVGKLEQGLTAPTWATARALAEALGVSVAAFEQSAKRQPKRGPGRPRKE